MKATRHQLIYRGFWALFAFMLIFSNSLRALEWVEKGGYRLANLKVEVSKRMGFKLLDYRVTGVGFANRLSRQLVAKNRNLANGSGVTIGDVDGDELPDIYFCGLQTDNKLFRNRGGWQFEDTTVESGVACPRQYCTGALLADVDGDSDNDLLVTGLAKGTRLFLNDGFGKFTEKKRFGIVSQAGSHLDGHG